MRAKRKRRAHEERAVREAPRITAQPTRPKPHEHRPVPEPGLSVDAENLGAPFLAEATEQGNFESALEPDLRLNEAPPSDEPLVGTEQDATVWERTLRADPGPESDIRELLNPRLREQDVIDREASSEADRLSADDERELEGADREPEPVDLHRDTVVDASLFDQQDPDTGEVRAPEVEADDEEAER